MRKAKFNRKTYETDITINLNLEGSGKTKIETGIPFFDHMLTSFAKHARLDLEIKAAGDIQVDFHHTMEDVGIVLGKVIKDCLGDKKGVRRFADATIPLDEALSRVVIDLSGRPFLSFNVIFPQTDDGSRINPYLFEEFFRALTHQGEFTLHIDCLRGKNTHHILESIFKAFAKSFQEAVSIVNNDLPSTKGVL